MTKHKGTTSLNFRENVSYSFCETAYYDALIAKYFNKTNFFPHKDYLGNLIEKLDGENPHQKVLYTPLAKN